MAGETESGQTKYDWQSKPISELLCNHYTRLCELTKRAFDFTQAQEKRKIPEEALDALEFAIDYAIQGTYLIQNGSGGAVYFSQSFYKMTEYMGSMRSFEGFLFSRHLIFPHEFSLMI